MKLKKGRPKATIYNHRVNQSAVVNLVVNSLYNTDGLTSQKVFMISNLQCLKKDIAKSEKCYLILIKFHKTTGVTVV